MRCLDFMEQLLLKGVFSTLMTLSSFLRRCFQHCQILVACVEEYSKRCIVEGCEVRLIVVGRRGLHFVRPNV